MAFGSFWAAHIIALHLWRQAYAPFRHKNQHSDSDLYDPTQCKSVCDACTPFGSISPPRNLSALSGYWAKQ